MDTEKTQSAKPAPVSAAERGSPPAARPDEKRTATPTLQNLEVNLVPDEVEVTLRPVAPEQSENLPRPMWHKVTSYPGALVSIWSRDDRLHVIRLSVGSQARGWNSRWARWTFAVRRVPSDQGGDAQAAQDILSPDGSELTLLVLPGEQRSVTLEFVAALDGSTLPGDYQFDVVMTDTEDGAAATSPGLLRLRHPAAALLNHLPALFTEHQEGHVNRFAPFEDRPFFERYLRGFEDAMEPTNEQLSQMALYFEADATPPDFLPWLGTWVALVLDENWPEMKRRRLIKEAVELYGWRGTRRGLARYLEIYTGVIPQINDQPFEGMRLGASTLLGQNTLLGDVPPHTFVITVALPDPQSVKEQIIRDIIESEKPAHTAYELRLVYRTDDEATTVE